MVDPLCSLAQGLSAPQPSRRLTQRLRHAITRTLTPAQRVAVELYFFDGLSQSEIARRLGVSQQVIHKRIYGVDRQGRRIGGALAKLRRALAATR
ncbi:MAG: sigma factor-like helix-turn-helix DNA-binding protein [Deltaproteobacteria bacterium]|nr:sigma factor-like helix-turn-helix DNA-binding protein [Deltaproteobacteria bacterium]